MSDCKTTLELHRDTLDDHERRLGYLERLIDKIGDSINENTMAVRQIKIALTGDEYGRKGISQIVQDMAIFKQKTEVKIQMAISYVMGGIFIVIVLWEIAKHFGVKELF